MDMQSVLIIGAVIALTVGLLFIEMIVDWLGWKKNSRPARAIRLLSNVSAVAFILATTYLVMFDMAMRVFSAVNVLAVWEDERAVVKDLVKDLIMPMGIIILTPILLLWRITAWGRCPYCNRFPVRRDLNASGDSWTWSCRAHPQEHHGPVGNHWWSAPQKKEE